MTVWLVRHATPCAVQGLCYGALDVVADQAETERVAQALVDVLPPGLPVLSSPRLRCVQLAQALRRLRPDLGVLVIIAINAPWSWAMWQRSPLSRSCTRCWHLLM